jgi:hypothetical protein
MGQKAFKRLRRLAREISDLKQSPTRALPEAYTQNGRRVLNPGKLKGTYKWLKKNRHLANRNRG